MDEVNQPNEAESSEERFARLKAMMLQPSHEPYIPEDIIFVGHYLHDNYPFVRNITFRAEEILQMARARPNEAVDKLAKIFFELDTGKILPNAFKTVDKRIERK